MPVPSQSFKRDEDDDEEMIFEGRETPVAAMMKRENRLSAIAAFDFDWTVCLRHVRLLGPVMPEWGTRRRIYQKADCSL